MADDKTRTGLLDKLRREFEASLAEHTTSRLEEFLTTRDPAKDAQLLQSEMAFRRQQGESLTSAEYEKRFPELADQIPELLNRTWRAGGSGQAASDSGEWKTRLLGDYELLEVLGRGGMGIVYRARQRELNRIVAVKTIASGEWAEAEELHRFRQEAEAAARLDHPGIVPVFEIGNADGVVFFSMGFVDGTSLDQGLHGQPLPPYDAARIVRDIAEALHFAHGQGVLHRDLKPGNILIDKNGRARITDFGLAKLVDRDGITASGAVVGTPSYMSPEQASGGATDERTDVYGIGAILYACISGRAPFKGTSTVDTIHRVVHDRPTALSQLRPGVPRDLETICHKCLEKAPENRYASAGEVATEVSRFMEGLPILARPVGVPTRAIQWVRRKPVIASLAAAVVLLTVVGTIVAWYFARLADERGESAKRGFSEARTQSELSFRTLRTMIHTVQDKLKDLDDAREIRKDILQQVLEDLQEFQGAYVASSRVDREAARVLVDLGNLYLNVGSEVGTDYWEYAEQPLVRSVEIYAALAESEDADRDLLAEAFTAAHDCGNNSREFRHFDKAIWAHQHARRFAMQMAAQYPDDLQVQRAMINANESLGEALLRSGDRDASRQYILDAVIHAEAYAENDPGIDAVDLLALCYCTEGDYFRDTGDLDAAAEAFQNMCAMTSRAMELEPDDEKHLLDRSTDFERLGDLEMSRGDFAKAVEHFEASREWAEMYIERDTDDLFRKQQSTWAYKKLAKACRALGDEDRAVWAEQELARINAILNPNPDSPTPDGQ